MKFCKFLAVFLLIAMLFSLVACGGDPVDTTPKDTTPPASNTDPAETGRDSIKDNVPADLSFEDEDDNTVTFFVRSNNPLFLREICSEDLTNDILYDAIHYRNIDVENRLGVTIEQIAQPGSENTTTEWHAWNETLATAVLTQTGDYDAAAIHTYCGSQLVFQNVFYDLFALTDDEIGYLDFEKPWWNQDSIETLAFYGSLFMVGGDMLVSETARTYALFFDKDLFDKKFPMESHKELYKLVDNQKWTIDKMIGYTSQVWDDVNTNGMKDDGDVAGFMYGAEPTVGTWVYALGMNYTETNDFDEPQLSYIYDPNIITAFEMISKLYDPEAPGVMGGTKWKETGLDKGKVLFTVAYLESGGGLRNSTANYGVLPLPKLTEDQDDYRTSFVGHVSMLAICADLPNSRAPMVTATLELMSAESYKQVTPAYYGKVLQGFYSNDEADARMYDKILDVIQVDVGACYFPKGPQGLREYYSLFSKARNTGFDLAQAIDSGKDAWETAFEEMRNDFAALIG